MQRIDREGIAAILVLAASGTVLLVAHATARQRDVAQYYASRSRALLSVYMACMFVMWVAFLSNARFAAHRLFLAAWSQ